MTPTKPVIMVVDDDPGMLELLKVRLRSAGNEVIATGSASEALALLAATPVAVLITDLRMEQMDGMALFLQVQQRWPTVPVIMLTAHGTIREAVDATQQGVFAFLTKPVVHEELMSTLRNALALHDAASHSHTHLQTSFLTRSARIYQLLELARTYAETDVNLLITGESGSGKEVLAKTIHQWSRRAQQAFVAINCSAIPEDLLESELFGHVRGAFTGASSDKEGLFASADGGTLMLDEIGDMPLLLQSKLLRVLQERSLRPVGGQKNRDIDLRVISATHRDLEKAIEDNTFREDLFYRLNVVNLHMPPLRERREDISLLANHFLEKISARNNKQLRKLAPEALQVLISYDWPGNVRQLENVMERIAVLPGGPLISERLLADNMPSNGNQKLESLSSAKKQFEYDYIVQLLQATNGNMTLAAELAGRNRSDFHKLVKRHQIDPSRFRGD